MAEINEISVEKKFSLVELLMIIMFVGIAFTIIVPLNISNKNHANMDEAIYNLQLIAQKNVEFYNNPDNGYYAFDVSMLDIKPGEMKKTDGKHIFEYSLTDSTVIATTNEKFGTKGAKIVYYLPKGPWALGNDKISTTIFDPAWLP